METVGQQLIITAIPALPALVFVVLALFGRLLKENAQYVAILGVSYAVLVIAIAAAEIAVGLAIVLAVFRSRRTVNIDEVNSMKG